MRDLVLCDHCGFSIPDFEKEQQTMPTTATKPRRAKKTSGRSRSGGSADQPLVDLTERVSSEIPEAVVRLPIEKLHVLPENSPPDPERVKEISAGFQSRGQDEPVIVRPAECCPGYEELPIGHYQILAGSTRLAAARALKWTELDARIRTDIRERKDALAFAAGNNADRREIGVLEKGHMIRAMLAAGATQEEAGRVYHVSRSEASNLVRLLDLPEPWMGRVSSGEMAYTVARLLLPYVGAPRLLQAMDENYLECLKWDESGWSKREEAEEAIDDVAAGCSRSIDAKKKRYRGTDYRVTYPCLADVDAHRDELAIVKIPVRDGRGKRVTELRATNVELFDKLQTEAQQQREDQTGKGKGAGRESEPAPLTPAERKARAEDRARELKEKIRQWRLRFLRYLIWDNLRTISDESLQLQGSTVSLRLFVSMAARRLNVERELARACGAKAPKEKWRSPDVWAALKKAAPLHCESWQIESKIKAAVCEYLWDPEAASKWIDLPHLADGEIRDAADELGIDLADAWATQAREKESPAWWLAAQYFGFHTIEGLERLGKELTVDLSEAPQKKNKIAALLVSHCDAESGPLALPKTLKK